MSESSGVSTNIECYCGRRAVLLTSWTSENLGRRFISCANYKRGRSCSFFAWEDPPMCHRAKIVIPGLLRRLNEFEEEKENLKKMNRKLEKEKTNLERMNRKLEEENKKLGYKINKMWKLLMMMPPLLFCAFWWLGEVGKQWGIGSSSKVKMIP